MSDPPPRDYGAARHRRVRAGLAKRRGKERVSVGSEPVSIQESNDKHSWLHGFQICKSGLDRHSALGDPTIRSSLFSSCFPSSIFLRCEIPRSILSLSSIITINTMACWHFVLASYCIDLIY